MSGNADLASTIPHVNPVIITCPDTVIARVVTSSWRGGREGETMEKGPTAKKNYLPMVDMEAPLERAQRSWEEGIRSG